ncbi:galactitol-1-phosphate 5-dehydrogenase [Butyricicoccus sp.]|uniref:galactitol-1-phosphate 5-dehydrogenase n=1 Tax=Butyricicoccus sp. TaxID=2049021 RepID=UPI003F16F91A
MKALRFYDKRDLRYEDAPDPVIEKPDEVIVKVKAVGICGSDLARYKNLGPYVPGNVWGHEFAGEVVEVGSGVTDIKPGDRVVGCPNLVCHDCEYCNGGHPARCESLNTIGAYAPGAFAEYIKMPAINLVHMVEGMTYEEGALVEPATVAIHGLYRTGIKMGYTVAVVGCGNIGLMSIAWAKAFGAKTVYALDIDDGQLETAKKFGADVVINTTNIDFHDEIRKYCNGVDLAIESAGNPFTAARVLGLPHKGGEVVYMGIPYNDVPVPRFYFERIMRNELNVIGSWCTISAPYPGKEWSNAVDYIGNHKVNLTDMISHQVNLSQGPEMFEKIIANPKEYGKVLLYPEECK